MKTKSQPIYVLYGGLLAVLAGVVGLYLMVPDSSPAKVHLSGWFTVLGAAFLTGYIDTCLGGGHGTVLTPVLILIGFPSTMAVPAILLSEICIGIFATILNHHAGNIQLGRGEQHRHVLLLLSGCSLVGSIVAVTVAMKLPQKWVNLYIGLMIVAIGLILTKRRGLVQRVSMKRIAVLGTIAAFNKGISGGGYGPLLTSGQVLSGVGEKGAVSITPPARALTGVISVLLYFVARGKLETALALPLITGSLLAMPVAVLTISRIDTTLLRKGITVATLLLGALLVFKAFH